VAPKVKIGDLETGLSLRIPSGFPAVMLNSLRYQDLLQDAVLAERDPPKLERKYETLMSREQVAELKDGLGRIREDLLSARGFKLLDITAVQSDFIQRYYSNVLERVENAGHRFGENLLEREKQALIAFVATL
jgi:23S rRNA A2030 N6-methylase RlmJ